MNSLAPRVEDHPTDNRSLERDAEAVLARPPEAVVARVPPAPAEAPSTPRAPTRTSPVRPVSPEAPAAPAAVPRRPFQPGGREAPTPSSRGALLFEVEVSNGIRTRLLQCFERSLTYGADEWRYDEIDSLSYQLYRYRLGLSPLSEVYEFNLGTRAGPQRLRLAASAFSRRSTKADTDLLFQAMVSLLHDRVGRPRNLRYLSELRSGATVRFGSVQLHRSGVRCGRGLRAREVAWDDLAGAEFVHGMVVVHRRTRAGATKRCGAVSMAEPNAVLLADLLPLAAGRFGRNPNRSRRFAAA
ncbi:MAG: hypothetical protein R2754_12950 [Microthrixaceae bacterium]